MSKKERIDKILSNIGYGSRKDVKNLIKKGMVSIDGNIVKDSGMKVDPYETKIYVRDKLVRYRKYIYIMMNKPEGYVSSTDDPINNTVVDLLDDEYKIFDPFPVGRLDKDTVGLLILSNDGKLAHRVLAPKNHISKTYFAKIQGKIDDEDITRFKEGILLDDGYKTMSSKLDVLKNGDISEVCINIKEGKFHQIKRMFKALDKKVIYLKRISMGSLKLDESLREGEYRELEIEEINLLTK
ncbi:pseudouridine synthase [Clostridiisalibacter paucivorans]|uniref:pseudouridine synthase n=1 Tax=Clostridiisalibacter paucivorans TaxID=408753 RepID=UPI0004787987|nr:pseudouridine synthase [Clostridiisalibacter paucivorans]